MIKIHKRKAAIHELVKKLFLRYNLFKNLMLIQLKHQALLLIILALYITFEIIFVMRLPVVGVHAWNESIYLSFSNYMKEVSNPFIFRAAYDPFRPDYNVGYLFFWASYIFQAFVQRFSANTLDSFLFSSRFFSLVSTLLSSLLIYIISIKLVKKRFSAYFTVVLFLFSPLVLYFGTKFQLEPFCLLIFLFSWLLVIRYTETAKLRYSLVAFTILGILILTRQIFAIYAPALLVTLLAADYSKKDKKLIFALAVFALLLGFLIPLAVTQVIVPEYFPLKFQFSRLMDSPRMALSSPWQTGNRFLLYFEKSLFPSLGLSFLFVPILLALLLLKKRNFGINRIAIVTFLFGGAVYFIFAFNHNIVHMYHSYYFIPAVILASSIVATFLLKINRKILVVALAFFLISSSVFSIWETTSFYGVGSERIYRDIDGYGNLDSVFAGYLINELYATSQSKSLLDNKITYYSLVQSPAVIFYANMPCFSYRDFFVWNATSKEYTGFNFFIDQESFLQNLQKRNLFILTVTPDVYRTQNQTFRQYIHENFVFLSSAGVYTFYLNQTIFNRATFFYKNLSFTILDEFKDNSIAPNRLSQSLLNMSQWYRISERSEISSEIVLNEQPQILSINSDKLSNKTLSIEIAFTTKYLPRMETVVSLDNVVDIRYGGSSDVYLELFSTDDGYRWFDGACIASFLWQTLTLTFVYDCDAQRAETYFNGVMVSNTFCGTTSNSFSPVHLSENHFIEISSTFNFTELYSVKLWNRALNETEISHQDVSNVGLLLSIP